MRRGGDGGSKAGGRVTASHRPARLLHRAPVVYVGPGALRALEGGAGILLGAQRPGWIDLMEFEPLCGAGWRAVVQRRFDAAGHWDAVGITIPRSEVDSRKAVLVRELVPGDVVLSASPPPGKPRALVNLGDRLVRAPLRVTRAAKPISTRSGRRSRRGRSFR